MSLDQSRGAERTGRFWINGAPAGTLPLWLSRHISGSSCVNKLTPPQDAARGYGSVILAARTSCAACVAFENNAPVLILRDAKEPLAALGPQAKHYD